ncbi:unnamed protein product [Paramecium octaurelia]|uniref:Transmembrane protein n=1 Tax=Paramecium octaurelia TaxID=43137 RepID=A0A8S1TXA6_PAROT|nr:unnamed protein product [Paramecium octaurelia]
MYSSFITKKPIGYSLLITCMILDLFIAASQYSNYCEFFNKPIYKVSSDNGITIYQTNSEGCVLSQNFELTYMGLGVSDQNAKSEVDNRITILNSINTELFAYLSLFVFYFHIITSFLPLFVDFILSISEYWAYKTRNTLMISLIRNLIVINWQLMQPLLLLTTVVNSITYKECFEVQDLRFLIPIYTTEWAILFIVVIVLETYTLFFFLVKWRNEFPCYLLIFQMFHFGIFHTVIIYNMVKGSKKLLQVLFTYKQWVTVFEIQKLYLEFYVIQERFRNHRIQQAKFAQLYNQKF